MRCLPTWPFPGLWVTRCQSFMCLITKLRLPSIHNVRGNENFPSSGAIENPLGETLPSDHSKIKAEALGGRLGIAVSLGICRLDLNELIEWGPFDRARVTVPLIQSGFATREQAFLCSWNKKSWQGHGNCRICLNVTPALWSARRKR